MANNNSPFGLKPYKGASGVPFNFELIPATIAYNDTQAIYRGDPVQKLTTGFISQWDAGVAVSQLAGIFWGVEYLSTAQAKMVSAAYWPGSDVASTAQDSIVAKIIPCTGAPGALFIAQSDATGVAFANIGENIDVALGTGSTTTGWSGAYLNVGTLAVTATLPFRIERLYGGSIGAGGEGGIQPGSTGPYSGSATGAYNWVIVRANVSGAGATGLA